MGFKTRPPCCIEGCNNSALICMFNKFFCGDCVIKWNKKQEEAGFKQIQEAVNGS